MNNDKNTNESATPDGFQDELISAYLDGELSPAVKLRVEEQLMDSAAHRQLFDELKSLRHSLQALPEDSLDRDFAARVMQRAEQQLLTEDVEGANASPSPVALPDRTFASSKSDAGAWRGLIWSVAAVAAAVMLIVFGPQLTQQENNRPVVANDPAEVDERVRENQLGAEQPTENAAALRDTAADRERTDLAAAEALAKKISRAGELKSQSNDRAEPALPPAIAAATQPKDDVMAKATDERPVRANKPDAEAAADTAKLSLAVNEFQQQGVPYEYADMMVVSVDVTPEALSRHFMDELLQENEIQTELARVEVGKENKNVDQLSLDKSAEKGKQQIDDRQLAQLDAGQGAGAVGESVARRAQRDEFRKRDEVAQRKLLAGRKVESSSSQGGDVDLMVVVATPQQIQQLLGAMRSQRGDVLAMAIDRPVALADSKNRDASDGMARLNRGKAFGERAEADVAKRGGAHAGIGAAFGALETATADANSADATVPPRARDENEANREAVVAAPGAADKTFEQDALADESMQPKYRNDDSPAQDAESFRGIARRLRLDEDFQKLLVQPPNAGARSDPTTTADGARSDPTALSDAAVREPNKLVRVLFVLRAANRAPAAPLAETLPAEISPANAALQEPATRGSAAAPVDE